jgi:CRISPR/Cas system-associated endonuclease Cas1
VSDTQLHVETDKGIILVDDTMDIFKELVSE